MSGADPLADPLAVGLGAAVDLFLAAKAAEGASPRTIEWYRMINDRAVRRFGADRPLDGVGAPELRAWLLELRESLAPESIAGYVRGLKAFGNWCSAEELGTAAGFRAPGSGFQRSPRATPFGRRKAVCPSRRSTPATPPPVRNRSSFVSPEPAHHLPHGKDVVEVALRMNVPVAETLRRTTCRR